MIFLLEGYRAAVFFLSRAIPARARRHWPCNFFSKGVRRGEKGFYITLSETIEELHQVARSHGWSLEQD